MDIKGMLSIIKIKIIMGHKIELVMSKIMNLSEKQKPHKHIIFVIYLDCS